MHTSRKSLLRRLEPYFVPTGRVHACPKMPSASCASVPIEDAETRRECLRLGTGVGMTLAPLRSHLIETMISICREPQPTPDGRIPALMFTLPWDHPLIDEFVQAKVRPMADPVLEKCNISVVVPPNRPEFWLSRVSRDIAKAAHACGDPGLIFSYNPMQTTAPCGELWLEPYEACTLGYLDMTKFIESPLDYLDVEMLEELGMLESAKQPKFKRFDLERLATIAGRAAKYLDLLVSHLRVPQKIRHTMYKQRRLGLGVIGWADALETMGVSYDSDKARSLATVIAKTMHCSAHLALPAGRNSGYLALAPTGRTAYRLGLSSGIEPRFSEARDLTPEAHLLMVAAWQKYIDGSIAKTVNLSLDTDVKTVWKVLHRSYVLGLKSITVFRTIEERACRSGTCQL